MGCENTDPIFKEIYSFQFSITLDEFLQFYRKYKSTKAFQVIESFIEPFTEVNEAGTIQDDTSYVIDNDIKRLSQIYELDSTETITLQELKKKACFLNMDKSKVHKKIYKKLDKCNIPFKQLQLSSFLGENVSYITQVDIEKFLCFMATWCFCVEKKKPIQFIYDIISSNNKDITKRYNASVAIFQLSYQNTRYRHLRRKAL